MAMQLRFKTPSRLAGSSARQLAAIYESSFPPAEREPTDELLRGMATKSRRCHVAMLGDVVVAFAIVSALPRGIQFLEYFAVKHDCRNRDIGSNLFGHLVTDSAARSSTGIVFEVEDPALGEGSDADVRSARIRFYRRLGAEVVACAPAYQAPSSRGREPLHYLLMWSGIGPAPKPLDGPALRECVMGMLVSGYGLSETDPLVKQVLSGLTC
jgi:ribosomal protein S18 acetylase RimI-like enzyme